MPPRGLLLDSVPEWPPIDLPRRLAKAAEPPSQVAANGPDAVGPEAPFTVLLARMRHEGI